MKADINRIMNDIINISAFNSNKEGNGCTRFSYSDEDRKAKEYIIEQMRAAGFDVYIDPIGNIRGKLKGIDSNSPIVISGSHIDTVRNGGNYDGVLGVVAAIEIGRVFKENNIKNNKTYEAVVFVEEEGVNFGVNLVGSKAIAGKIELEDLIKYKNENRISMLDMISEYGGEPNRVKECAINSKDIDSMVELHIEQASVLDVENKEVGIIKGINGLRWYEIKIKGESNHAGATPMNLRKDPMVEASKIICKLPDIVEEVGDDSTVATVGNISSYPNLTNVIPEHVVFTLDLRGIEKTNTNKVLDRIEDELEKITNKGFQYEIKLLTEAKETKSSERLLNIIETEANKLRYNYKTMYSGSNHDTSIISEIADVAMIFVPSINGKSHCKEEFTKDSDIEKGVNLLIKTIYELTK